MPTFRSADPPTHEPAFSPALATADVETDRTAHIAAISTILAADDPAICET
jgi:hypothetical protein